MADLDLTGYDDTNPVLGAARSASAQADKDAQAIIAKAAKAPAVATPGTPSPQPASGGDLRGSLPDSPTLRAAIERVARARNMPANILAALAQQESGYNANAVNAQTNAGGLLQYTPQTAQNRGINPFSIDDSLNAAAADYTRRVNAGLTPLQAVQAHFGGDNQSAWGAKTQAYGAQVMQRAKDILNQYRAEQGAAASTDAARAVTSEDLPAPAKAPTAAPETAAGAFTRRFGDTFSELKGLGEGTVGLIGDTASRVPGLAGIGGAVRDWGYKGYLDQQAAEQKTAQSYDDVVTATSDAIHKGDWGGLLKNIAGDAGYITGQGIQAIASGFGAGAVAKVALRGVVGQAVDRAVAASIFGRLTSGQVAKETAANVAKGMTSEAASAAAKRTVSQRVAGAIVGVTGLNATQELGTTYGGARDTAAQDARAAQIKTANPGISDDDAQNLAKQQLEADPEAAMKTQLTGAQLARAAASGVAATAVEDLGEAAAGLPILRNFMHAAPTAKVGIANYAKAIAKQAGIGLGSEAATELAQTAIERFGSNQSLTDNEAIHDYINSAVLGGMGGAAFGGGAAAISHRGMLGATPTSIAQAPAAPAQAAPAQGAPAQDTAPVTPPAPASQPAEGFAPPMPGAAPEPATQPAPSPAPAPAQAPIPEPASSTAPASSTPVEDATGVDPMAGGALHPDAGPTPGIGPVEAAVAHANRVTARDAFTTSHQQAPAGDMRVVATGNLNAPIAGTVERYAPRPGGGWHTTILGDDGQTYAFHSGDGVTITPEAAPAEQAASAPDQAQKPQPATPAPAQDDVNAGSQDHKTTDIQDKEKEAEPRPATEAKTPETRTVKPDAKPAPLPPLAPEKPIHDMTESEARTHLRYLGTQAKETGWTRLLRDRRVEVERHIDQLVAGKLPLSGAHPASTPDESQSNAADTSASGLRLRSDDSGRDSATGGLQGDQQGDSTGDVDQSPVGGSDTPEPSERGSDDLPDTAEPGHADSAVAPNADEAAAEPATKTTDDPTAGKWFGTQEKAQAWLDKKGLADSHDVRISGSRFVLAPKADAVASASSHAATSPENDKPEPTDAQKDAGNYAKGHLKIGALDVSIENPAGTSRRPEWPALKHAYGYVRGTEGADGDHVDVFMSPHATDTSRPVYVIDQKNADGSFDEHKAMLGFNTPAEAREAYLSNYEDGWQGLGGIKKMTFENFSKWATSPHAKKPLTMKEAPAAQTVEATAPAPEAEPEAQGQGSDAAQTPEDRFAQIDAEFAENRKAMRNFKIGDAVSWDYGGSAGTGTIKGIDSKEQGRYGVEGEKGQVSSIPARRLAAHDKNAASADVQEGTHADVQDDTHADMQDTAHANVPGKEADTSKAPRARTEAEQNLWDRRFARLMRRFPLGQHVSVAMRDSRLNGQNGVVTGHGEAHLDRLTLRTEDGKDHTVHSAFLKRRSADQETSPVISTTEPVRADQVQTEPTTAQARSEASDASDTNPRDTAQRDQGSQAGPVSDPSGSGDAGATGGQPVSADLSGGDGREGVGDLRAIEDGQPALRGRSDAPDSDHVTGGPRSGSGSAGGSNRSNRRNAAERDNGPDSAGLHDAADQPAAARSLSPLADYRYKVGETNRDRSWREVARRNVEAIEIAKRIEQEGRPATAEERKTLAAFNGWGASEIANGIFPTRMGAFKPEWKELGERLRNVLTDDEYAAARRTTQYAHYTSEGVIRAIHDTLDRMGFKGGKILEPGAGTGRFRGMQPKRSAENSQYTGIEYDPLTSRIAEILYPQSSIRNEDFTRSKLPKDYFDAAIGNPPFGNIPILDDAEYKKNRFNLHDYFFAKTMDRVRPGGIVAFVTSRGTMDKAKDKARSWLAERANLLGAVRLPQTAFKDNAGTEVVTDILFLQKKGEGVPDKGASWTGTKEIDVAGTPQRINEYYLDHPDMVLGDHASTGSMYNANEYTVTPPEGDIEEHLGKALKKLPRSVFRAEPWSTAGIAQVREIDFNPKATKEGSLYLGDDGTLRQIRGGAGEAITSRQNAEGKTIALKAREMSFLKGYVGLRDALKQAQSDQLMAGDWEASLKALNKTYDAFVADHGHILAHTVTEREGPDGDVSISTRFKNGPILNLDAENALIRALEHIKPDGTISKSKLLTGRVLNKPLAPVIKSVQDAHLNILASTGRVDIPEAARLAGVSEKDAIEQLGQAIYRDPSTGWQEADAYLSGDVVRKLAEARSIARTDPAYQRNVEALANVQPLRLAPTDISASPGSHWIPADVMKQFATEIMGQRYATISRSAATSTWHVDGTASPGTEWETARRTPLEMLDAVLNNREIRVTDTFKGDGGRATTILNTEQTEAAAALAAKIRTAFRQWIWQDAERTENLTNYYNDNFNNIVPRTFNGDHLTLPGISARFDLYSHQKRAIWRGIQDGNVYLAHAVGAGKTFTMIATGMEERRLGLSKRPLYAVPNHMLAQFAREFQELYPTAHIMVADEEQFHGNARREFVARAALNDPDAIIITHSAFGRIPVSEERINKHIESEIDRLKELAEEEEGDKRTIKQLERRMETLQRRLLARTSTDGKDNVLNFEELGVDRLLVDEFHEFRKLDFMTNQNRVKGIDPQGSLRATDMYLKVQYLNEINPGRALVAASGTPVTNTMGELFTVQRFMDPEQLERDGLDHFDSWATQFGEIVTGLEQNAGGGYEPVARFANFINVPDLMRRVRSFMDVLTAEDLGSIVVRPDIEGGARKITTTPAPRGFKEYQQSLNSRIADIKRRSGPPKAGEDIILKVISDGRFSAIDMRFVDPEREADPDSKLNRAISRIAGIYRDTAENEYHTDGAPDPIKGSSLMFFTDLGLGEQSAASRGFDMRKWISSELIRSGVDPRHIAFMRDYKQAAKKERLFNDMRQGKVRILIGGKDMETGVNAQKRLIWLGHLDSPWFPASIEQREGRGIRQGNQNGQIGIEAFATKGSYDSTMWGMNARKQRFISQAFSGDISNRRMEDISEASGFEMASALASGDERYLRLAGLRSDVERLTRLRTAHAQQQRSMRSQVMHAQDALAWAGRKERDLKAALRKREPLGNGDDFTAVIRGKTVQTRDAVSDAIFAAAKRLAKAHHDGSIEIGKIGGFDIVYTGRDLGKDGYNGSVELDMPGADALVHMPHDIDFPIRGIAARVSNQINGLDLDLKKVERQAEGFKEEIAAKSKRLGVPFPEEAELDEKEEARDLLEAELAADTQEADAAQDEAAQQEAQDSQTQPEEGEDPAIPDNIIARIPLSMRVETRKSIDKLRFARRAGKIDPEEYDTQLGHILSIEDERIAEARMKRGMKAAAPRERGPDWLNERILRAKRHGDISPEAADMAQWLIAKNPNIAEDLAISIRPSADGQAAGSYNPFERLVTLLGTQTEDDVLVHEILHHTERMMPEDVQDGIVAEWKKAFERTWKEAGPDLRTELANLRRAAFGDGKAYRAALEAFAQRRLSVIEHYQLLNPSEYWAVNGTRIIAARAQAQGWVAKARQWLAELIQKARHILRLPSDAPALRGIRTILRGDGKMQSETMLQGRLGVRDDLMPSLKSIRSPTPPVATLTGKEMPEAKDMRELGRIVASWYVRNLVGMTVRNKETGWAINFNARGSKKVSGRKGDILMRIVPALPDILREGRLIESDSDNRERDHIQAIHKFAATVTLEGKPYDVIATVRQTQDGKFHYDLGMDRSGQQFEGQAPLASYSADEGDTLNLDFAGNAGVTVPDIPLQERDRVASFAGRADEGAAMEGSTVNTDIGSDSADFNGKAGQGSPVRVAIIGSEMGPAAQKLMDHGFIVLHDTAPEDAPAGADAWTTPDGRVHLLQSIPADLAAAKLMHETFHAGVEPLIGSKAWNTLQSGLEEFYRRARMADSGGKGGPLAQSWRDAYARVKAAADAGDTNLADPDGPISVQEFGAYLVENRAAQPRAIQSWVDNAIGAIKAWALARYGKQLGRVTDAQLVSLTRSALEAGAATERALLIGNLTDKTLYSTQERAKALVDALADEGHDLDQINEAAQVKPRASTRLARDIGYLSRIFATPRHIAALHRGFAPVFQAVLDRMKRRDQIVHALNRDYASYAALPQPAKAKVNSVLELGRLLGRTYERDELLAGIHNPGTKRVVEKGPSGQTVRGTKPLNAALSGPGEVITLTAPEADAYLQARTMFDNALDMLGDQLASDLGHPELRGAKARADFLQSVRDIRQNKGRMTPKLEQLAQMLQDFEQAKRGGYVPFSRFGDYVIAVKRAAVPLDIFPNPRVPNHVIARDLPENLVELAESLGAQYDPLEGGYSLNRADRIAIERANEQTIHAERVETGLRDFPHESIARWNEKDAINIPSVRKAHERIKAQFANQPDVRVLDPFPVRKKTPDKKLDLADIDALAQIAQIDPQQWDQIRDKLGSAIQSMSFRRHFFASDNVPGYSTDFERSMTDYMAGTAGYIARRQFNRRTQDALANIEAARLHTYAQRYLDYTDRPQEELSALRQIGFLTYIAGNVSSGLVNLTQQAIMTAPTLAQFASPARVASEMARANLDALKMMTLNRDIGLNMFDPNKAPADVRKDLKKAWVDGEFIPTATFEIMATANQRNIGARPIRRGFERAAQFIGLTFSVPERINRIATWIAAHRLSRDPAVQAAMSKVYGKNELARQTMLGRLYKPANVADFLVDETQFKLGKANRANLMRGPGTAIFQFKGFSLNSIETYGRMILNQGRSGRIAAAASLAIMASLAGMWQLPGADDSRKAIEALLSFLMERDIDVRTALRGDLYAMTGSDWIAAAADRGGPFASGLDLGRVGLGNIAPTSNDITSLLGIPYDLLIARPSDAVGKLYHGQPFQALMAVAPKAISNLGTAAAMATDGFRDSKGRTVLSRDDLSAVDVLQKALGFTPTDITNVRDFHYADERMQHATDDQKTRFTQRAGALLAHINRTPRSDTATRDDLMKQYQQVFKDVENYNENVAPAQKVRITPGSLRTAMRTEMLGIPGTYGRERKQARGAASALHGVFGIANAEDKPAAKE